MSRSRSLTVSPAARPHRMASRALLSAPLRSARAPAGWLKKPRLGPRARVSSSARALRGKTAEKGEKNHGEIKAAPGPELVSVRARLCRNTRTSVEPQRERTAGLSCRVARCSQTQPKSRPSHIHGGFYCWWWCFNFYHPYDDLKISILTQPCLFF